MRVIYYDRGFVPHKLYISEALVEEVRKIQKEMIVTMGIDPKRLEVLSWMKISEDEDIYIRIGPVQSEIGFYTYVGWYPFDGPDKIEQYSKVFFDLRFKKAYCGGNKDYIKIVEKRHKKYLIFEKICGT
jgi:hypothetical protein